MASTDPFDCIFCNIKLKEIFIKCDVCEAAFICLACFSNGLENDHHKNDHAYRVINLKLFETFDDWDAYDELELNSRLMINPNLVLNKPTPLDTVDSISTGVDSNSNSTLKTLTINGFGADACVRHFEKWIEMMDGVNGDDRMDETLLYRTRLKTTIVQFKDLHQTPSINNDFTGKHVHLSLVNIRPAVNSKLYRLMNGYRAPRGDFETEYTDKFELKHIADLTHEIELDELARLEDADSVEDNDYYIEHKLKLTILHMYRQLIEERYERRWFIKQFGLLNELVQQDYKSNLINNAKPAQYRPLIELNDRHSPVYTNTTHLQKLNTDSLYNWPLPVKYQRLFLNFDEYLKFTELLNHYGYLKKRLDDLKEYRANGIRSLKHVSVYKAYKLKRLNRVATVYMASLLTSMNRFDARNSDSNVRIAKEQCNEWFRKFVISEKSLMGGTTNDGSDLTGATVSSTANSVQAPTAPLAYPAAQLKHKHNPLKIENYPDSDKLDEDEKEFCRVARIQPSVYLRVKAILIVENKKAGFCTYSRARKIAGIDVNRTRLIHNLMLKLDLINPNPPKDE